MYIPQNFEITDKAIIEQFLAENSFATLVSKNATFPTATHIPIEYETNSLGEKVLWTHMAKANLQWKEFETSPEVLVIFLSNVHGYISSSWYEKPNVPTWNYLSVQIEGKAKLIEGEELWEALRRITNRYEKNSTNPVALDTLPPNVQRQINGLVGIEINILKMQAAFKLSQNRDENDFNNIIAQLKLSEDLSSKLLADAMQKHYAK